MADLSSTPITSTKITQVVLGSAIGDAWGDIVNGMTAKEIEKNGWVDGPDFLREDKEGKPLINPISHYSVATINQFQEQAKLPLTAEPEGIQKAIQAGVIATANKQTGKDFFKDLSTSYTDWANSNNPPPFFEDWANTADTSHDTHAALAVAPVTAFLPSQYWRPATAYAVAQTHGSPTAIASGLLYAAIIRGVVSGKLHFKPGNHNLLRMQNLLESGSLARGVLSWIEPLVTVSGKRDAQSFLAPGFRYLYSLIEYTLDRDFSILGDGEDYLENYQKEGHSSAEALVGSIGLLSSGVLPSGQAAASRATVTNAPSVGPTSVITTLLSARPGNPDWPPAMVSCMEAWVIRSLTEASLEAASGEE